MLGRQSFAVAYRLRFRDRPLKLMTERIERTVPMSMMRFGAFFPELAERETRCLRVIDRIRRPGAPGFLPPGEYAFDELYCTEPGCDCQRVILNVYSHGGATHEATINHAFKPPKEGDLLDEQTFLDPLNRQSELSEALLKHFTRTVLADPKYAARLVTHYRLFKAAADDPNHPCQALIRSVWEGDPDETPRRKPLAKWRQKHGRP